MARGPERSKIPIMGTLSIDKFRELLIRFIGRHVDYDAVNAEEI